MAADLKTPTSSKLSGPEPFKTRTVLAVVSNMPVAKGCKRTLLMLATARKSKSTWCLQPAPVRDAGDQRPSFCPKALLGWASGELCELALTWQE